MKETPILKRIMLGCSNGPVRLWRNNCGSLQDKTGRWVKFGIANPGGSDLIGFRTITVGPEHLGKRLAIFAAVECKSTSGRIRPKQQVFIDNVKKCGGLAGVARSVEEAKKVLTI
jgi:hypothetical protein